MIEPSDLIQLLPLTRYKREQLEALLEQAGVDSKETQQVCGVLDGMRIEYFEQLATDNEDMQAMAGLFSINKDTLSKVVTISKLLVGSQKLIHTTMTTLLDDALGKVSQILRTTLTSITMPDIDITFEDINIACCFE